MTSPELPDDLGPPGLGLDVEPLARWRELRVDADGWRRLKRSFSADELHEIGDDSGGSAAASRWVAKEAVVKALAGDAGVRDVEVLRGPQGGLVVVRPTLPGRDLHVSVSHTRDHVFGAAWTSPRGDRPMLRPARREDAEDVLRWRNHPTVREWSFTTREIELDEHLAWWERVQDDPTHHLYVFERDGEPAGVVNYDVEDDGSAVWGFYLDLEGIGEGPDLLRAWGEVFTQGIDLAFDELDITELKGEVLTGNRGVRALHMRHGFEESEPYEREVDGEPREAVHMRLTPDMRRGGRR